MERANLKTYILIISWQTPPVNPPPLHSTKPFFKIFIDFSTASWQLGQENKKTRIEKTY